MYAFEAAGIFPSYLLHMVQIGEESGTLDTVMDALSTHYAREDAIHQSIKSSVTYPVAVYGRNDGGDHSGTACQSPAYL